MYICIAWHYLTTSNALRLLVTREEKCLVKTRLWQSSVFECIWKTVRRGRNSTNE